MSTMTSDRYVPTQAIQQAVRGQEMDVLRALGIPWEDGGRHISCPYPDHLDQNPSWRWDGHRATAFCTCITQRGGHSILEIVKRVKGIDYEAAKLRVAEILGRGDLIETKGGQRMVAASLLQPPADQRDETLGPRYLAYRLGVLLETVPRRLDGMGLVLALQGRQLAALTGTAAVIRTARGAHLTHRRRPRDPLHPAERCLVWELA
jgi:hypothetical protein